MTARIPTTLITGFLGVGKTTAILHLLKHKPAGERWAVLVNEFGEIGIDGAILAEQGAVIKEVPGGCLCCVAGLPLQIGLNMLIAKARPDRLLIEPTGLGHPRNVLEVLTGDYYRDLLDLRATLCLVDARRVEEERYREHESFRAQLELADLVIGNKADLCNREQRRALDAFLAELSPPRAVHDWVVKGQLAQEWLDQPRAAAIPPEHHHHHDHQLPAEAEPPRLAPGQRWLRRQNRGGDHASCGWLFAAEECFDFGRLFALLSGLPVDRLKGVVNTDRGAYIFNLEGGVLSVNDAGAAPDSRLEVIHQGELDWDALEQALLGALQTP